MKKAGSKKAQTAKFVIDCWQPVDDNVIKPQDFEKFLHDNMKVADKGKTYKKHVITTLGKKGNLGSKVSIARDKSKIIITAELPFSKRYLKYLAKKYLKKQQLRDFIQVIATSKGAYELKYFKASAPAEDV